MKQYMFLTIRKNESPCYGEMECENIKKGIYKYIGFCYDQMIDGENHLKYLLENEKVELKIIEDEDIAIFYFDGETTYICSEKETMFNYAILKDSTIEKDIFVN